MWPLLVVLLYALFAGVFTIGKWGLGFADPFFLVGSRMTAAAVLMLGFLYFYDRKRLVIRREDIWRVIGLGVFNIYLTNVCEFWGLQYLTSSKTCLLYSLSPFVAALFSYMMLSETMSRRKWVGLFIGVVGCLPILLHNTAGEEAIGQFLYISWPELAIISAVFFSVYGWILLKQLCDRGNYSPFAANGWSMLVGGALALVHSSAVEEWAPLPVSDVTSFMISALLLIVISNLICYNLYGLLLRRYSATFISFAGFTTPLFTALFSWLLLAETVTWHFYASFSVVLVGLVIFHRDELRQEKTLPLSSS